MGNYFSTQNAPLMLIMPISFYSTLTEADRTKNFTYKHQLAVEERKGDIPSIPRSQTLNPETKNPI